MKKQTIALQRDHKLWSLWVGGHWNKKETFLSVH